jgi:hypothetical protein
MKRQLDKQSREINNLREQVARQQAMLQKGDQSESTSVPAVSDTSGTSVPERDEDAQEKPKTPWSLSFHDLAGENIQLSQENRVATRIRGCRRGAVFSNAPLVEGVTAWIEVVASVDGWNGALAVGVTGTDPSTIDTLPEKIWTVPDTVLVGYCGRVRSSDEAEEDVNWRSEELTDQDLIGITIDQRGMMVLSVNNRVEVELELGSVSKPRFLLVDVYGRTVAVRMLEPRPQSPAQRPVPQAIGSSPLELSPPKAAPLSPPKAAPLSPPKVSPPVRLSHWLSDLTS